jgi:hypothetical protein
VSQPDRSHPASAEHLHQPITPSENTVTIAAAHGLTGQVRPRPAGRLSRSQCPGRHSPHRADRADPPDPAAGPHQPRLRPIHHSADAARRPRTPPRRPCRITLPGAKDHGTTTLPPAALTGALAGEVGSYHGVDSLQVRTGSGPQVMATPRNLVIGIFKLAGCRNIAAACSRHAQDASRVRWPHSDSARINLNGHRATMPKPAVPWAVMGRGAISDGRSVLPRAETACSPDQLDSALVRGLGGHLISSVGSAAGAPPTP